MDRPIGNLSLMKQSLRNQKLLTFLLQYSLDNALCHLIPSPYFQDFVSGCIKKCAPLAFSSFLCREHCHHNNIKLACNYSGTYVRYHHVVDEDLGIAWGHCFGRMFKNFGTFFIVPVMEYLSEVVCSRSCRWMSVC